MGGEEADCTLQEGTPDVHQMNYGGMPLRVVMIDGDPWFVAADVCGVLNIVNTTYAVRNLGPDEVQRTRRTSLYPNKGGAAIILISESGLNKLIMRSDKPEAKPFQEWVTRDVLPSIRKTGSACPLRPTQGPLQGGLIVLL